MTGILRELRAVEAEDDLWDWYYFGMKHGVWALSFSFFFGFLELEYTMAWDSCMRVENGIFKSSFLPRETSIA